MDREGVFEQVVSAPPALIGIMARYPKHMIPPKLSVQVAQACVKPSCRHQTLRRVAGS